MTAITRTSPLDLGDLKKTQRRVAALLQAPDFCTCPGRHKRIPAGFCYICSQLDPRGQGSRSNPYRHLLARGGPSGLAPPPPGPHPTFVNDDDDFDDYDYDDDDDDGFEDESLGLGEGSQDGAMFDTSIVREAEDPRLYHLPCLRSDGGPPALPQRARRRNKHGRILPVVSENTFLTANQRGQGHDLHLHKGNGLRLPRLPNKRASLTAQGVGQGQGQGEGQGQGQGQGHRKRKEKDPRRLHSERIDRRGVVEDAERAVRSDSAMALGLGRSDTGLSREKTDPPLSQSWSVSPTSTVKCCRRSPWKTCPRATFPQRPSPTPANARDGRGRGNRGGKGRELAAPHPPSPAPCPFQGRRPSAAWSPRTSTSCRACALPAGASARITRGAEGGAGNVGRAWVTRSGACHVTLCVRAVARPSGAGTPSERKASLGSMLVTPASTSPSKARHQNCSPSKLSAHTTHSAKRSGSGAREASANRVRFHHGDGVVYPERDSFPDVDDVWKGRRRGRAGGSRAQVEGSDPEVKAKVKDKSPGRSFGPDVHRKAYDLALADAKTKQLFAKKKKKRKPRAPHTPQQGILFSYFPRLTRRQPEVASDTGSPKPPIGVRADWREGKQLRVKKGLKHVLGNVKLADYYPGVNTTTSDDAELLIDMMIDDEKSAVHFENGTLFCV